jgi:hypothetical protein
MSNYIIEKGTNYSYLLNAQTNPTFENIRQLSVKFVMQLPEEVKTFLWEELENGVQILDSEGQLSMYMYAYGQMHLAKLFFAFEKLPEMPNSDLHIIDWGCGQGLATIAFNDFLESKGKTHTIKSVTLIEPSEFSLKRAALHTNKLLPKTKIRTVNKYLDEIVLSDISIPKGEIIIHLFSNILDVPNFSINSLAENIKSNQSLNFLICVSPSINDFRIERLNEFINSFEDFSIYEDLTSNDWKNNWTIDCKVAMICNFKQNSSESKSTSTSCYSPVIEGPFDEPPTDGGCYLPF